jgi:cell division protein FtsW (lipid II flippase)
VPAVFVCDNHEEKSTRRTSIRRNILNVLAVGCVLGIVLAFTIKVTTRGEDIGTFATCAIAITVLFTVLGIVLLILFGKPVFAFLRRHTWTLAGSVLLFLLSCVVFVLFLFAACGTAVWGADLWRAWAGR